jgi:two-component system sensor histidine kinase SenX3
VANLVDNGLRFSDGQPVVVEARSIRGGVELAVSDRGPGIAESERERVFERFYRADDARSSTSGGSGLGLAIVAEIVELHHGRIEIAANAPTGCRVLVRLPDAVRSRT